MRMKNRGFAVVALLVGIAVAATVYIASYGRSSKHAEAPAPDAENAAAAGESNASTAPVPKAFALTSEPERALRDELERGVPLQAAGRAD
jgi:multisubunit Na+/H+ antiporter MnhC subunit